MSAEAALLAEVPLFQLLDDEERVSLAAHLDVVKFPTGHVVFNYGEPGDAMYIVRAGKAELSFKQRHGRKDRPGKRARAAISSANSPSSTAARAAPPCSSPRKWRRCSWTASDLEHFLRQHPHAAVDLLTALGKRLRKTSEILRHTATRNVNEETEDKRTVVQKTADWIAEFSGSIPFLLLHAALFAAWIGWNMLAARRIFASIRTRSTS